MQQAISSFTPERYMKPVSFNCIVNKKALKAEIIEEKDNPINYTFIIGFSDSTMIKATALENGTWWVDDVTKLRYMKSIEHELHDFIGVKDLEWDKFEIQYDGKTLLVWVSKGDDDDREKYYSVHFNGSYQFHLKKVKGTWTSRSTRVLNTKIDEKLASYIAMTIETLE